MTKFEKVIRLFLQSKCCNYLQTFNITIMPDPTIPPKKVTFSDAQTHYSDPYLADDSGQMRSGFSYDYPSSNEEEDLGLFSLFYLEILKVLRYFGYQVP